MFQNRTKIVRKLTPAPSERHTVAAKCWIRFCRTVGGIVVLSSSIAAAGAQAPEWQPVGDISAAAETYLWNTIGAAAEKTSVQAGNLDSRHRLAYCDQPLQPFLRRGTQIKSRTIVGVRCNGSKPWKVYVPVDVIVTETVFVAKRTLPRGHALTASDVTTEQRDVSRLLSGYISDIRQLSGQRLKTQLLAGKILTPAMLQAETAVRRGQTVTVTTGQGQFSITTSGTALMDGAINQRIRVKNLHSGRVVEGIVRSREHVEIILPGNHSLLTATTKVSPILADIRSSNNDR